MCQPEESSPHDTDQTGPVGDTRKIAGNLEEQLEEGVEEQNGKDGYYWRGVVELYAVD